MYFKPIRIPLSFITSLFSDLYTPIGIHSEQFSDLEDKSYDRWKYFKYRNFLTSVFEKNQWIYTPRPFSDLRIFVNSSIGQCPVCMTHVELMTKQLVRHDIILVHMM